MWLSNTATTGMMVPVAEQVIEQMEQRIRRRLPETATQYVQRSKSGGALVVNLLLQKVILFYDRKKLSLL